MRIYKSFEEFNCNSSSILTVGTFDGVHLGHRIIIERLTELAKKNDLRSVIITFDPHPQSVLFNKHKDPIRLLTVVDERLKLFEYLGVNDVLIIPFSVEFSRIPPEVFIKEYLFNKVGMKKILIGYDHMFGKNRKGNVDLLKRLSNDLGFETEKIEPRKNNGVTISSTKIREAISRGRIEEANKMLGYYYYAKGTVVKGDKRGATLGYPTANVGDIPSVKLIPANGVYLVNSVIRGKKRYGMANIGTRPTFAGDSEPILEVHFFDFDGDIYGEILDVSFMAFLRFERKFSGAEALKKQLDEDKKECLKKIKRF